MTISYSGNFFKLLLRWKGSLWKTVWRELLVFLLLYFLISILYRVVLTPSQRDTFENISLLFDSFTMRIPVSFLLGFFVTAVVRRWWEQFQLVAWPDDILSYINLIFPDNDPKTLTTRRTIARWLCLTAALAWRDISRSVRRRFPTMDHLINGNLMTPAELRLYESVSTETIRWSLPMFWIRNVVDKEMAERSAANGSHSRRSVPDPPVMAMFYREMNNYRSCFRQLYCYDWVCIPLVYTQVAALATYGYFAICLLGRQYLDPSKYRPGSIVDLYVPYFTILQFFFYVGWFKVGQYLMRPFEEDDDDIELNYLLDRHVQTAFCIVDEIHRMEVPPIEDSFSELQIPTIPHTRMSIRRQQHPPKLLAKVDSKRKGDEEVVERLTVEEPSKRRPSRIRQF